MNTTQIWCFSMFHLHPLLHPKHSMYCQSNEVFGHCLPSLSLSNMVSFLDIHSIPPGPCPKVHMVKYWTRTKTPLRVGLDHMICLRQNMVCTHSNEWTMNKFTPGVFDKRLQAAFKMHDLGHETMVNSYVVPLSKTREPGPLVRL